jgi:hypothetical protein
MLKLALGTEKEFYELRDEWEALIEETEDLDFFSTWEWNYSWWKNFKEDKQLFLITIRDDANTLVGIFPGCIFRYNYFGLLGLKVLQFIGKGIDRNSIGEYSDFLDVIVHRRFKSQAFESLLAYLKSQSGLYDLIYLNGMKETSDLLSYLKNEVKNSSGRSRIEKDFFVYFASLPGDIDEYLNDLSSSFRASIRRKVRKWEKSYDGRLCTALDGESIEDFFVNFFRLVRKRHRKIMSNEREVFHRDVAKYSLERNRFWAISTNGDDKYAAVAVVYLFKDKGYFYQHAIDPQFYKDSPGMVLFYYMFEKLICNGITRLELLQGEYDYKKQFGKDHLFLFNVYLGMGTLRSRLYFLFYTNIQMARKLAKMILRRK